MCGLKEFGVTQPEGKDDKQKLTSVVGILSHLASQHSHDIRKALMALFKVRIDSGGTTFLSALCCWTVQ